MRASKPIRLAVVTETFPPDLNGVAMSLSRLVNGLLEKGHLVDLIRVRPNEGSDDQMNPRETNAGLSVTALRGLPIPAYPQLKMGLPATKFLADRWKTARPDVVHIATEGPLGWSALRAARRLGIPVSSDYRTQFDYYAAHYGMPWLAAPVGALLRGFHNRSDLTTVPTSALKHELSARGFRRLRVLGRGVDAQLFDPARRCDQLRASWSADPTTPVILCVGRLAAEKNLGLLIKAYESMSSSIPPPKLVLVGDGPLRDSLAAQCPTAIFAGRQSGVELARHYASADLFLFPSLSETFGNVVTESMASGLATVAFRHAAAAELIVNGSNGVLIEPTEPDSFVKASRDLAADWARCRAMGQLARQSVAHLDWPAIAEQFEAMIFALIEGEKPAATVLPVSRLRASGTRAA